MRSSLYKDRARTSQGQRTSKFPALLTNGSNMQSFGSPRFEGRAEISESPSRTSIKAGESGAFKGLGLIQDKHLQKFELFY